MSGLLGYFGLLLWIISLVYSDRNNEKMGPYDIVNLAMYPCEDEGTREITYTVKTRKVSRTEFGFKMNFTFVNRTMDDNLSMIAYIDQFTNGGWKEGFVVNEFRHVCTTLKSLFPKTFEMVMKAFGGEECNYQPGFYQLPEMTLSDIQISTLPTFFYNKYRFRGYFFAGSEKIGCLGGQVDVVPRAKKPKKKS